MAESKSSHTLGSAAAAEQRAVRKDAGGGASATVNVNDRDEDMEPESFTYNPYPEDPEETMVFGKRFKKGEAVEVSDPKVIRKLRNNPSFQDDATRDKAAADAGELSEYQYSAEQRAIATEQELVEALGEAGEQIDTRLPEAPQLASIAIAKQRKLVQELSKRDNPRPPEGGEGEAASASARRRKPSDE